MPTSIRRRDTLRTAIITLLLVLSLVLVGLLSIRTFDTVKSHQRLAKNVLRDYTTLAADEFERRASGVAIFGFYPLLGNLARVPVNEPLPAPETLSDQDLGDKDRATVANAAELARGFFRYLPWEDRLEVSGETLPDTVRAELREATTSEEFQLDGKAQVGKGRVTVLDVSHQGTSYKFAFVPVANKYLAGLLVDTDATVGWLEYFVGRTPLLPESLTDGQLDSEGLFLELKTPAGELIFREGDYQPQSLLVKRQLADDFSSFYDGLHLTVGIDPKVANRLIIGGLPRSNFPVLGSLWALATLMILVAMWLLRRERALLRMRSDFVSRVSHELRTPLTQIRMFAETLLLNRVRSDEERERSLQIIDTESRRLSHLVENILQFSRGERGTGKLKLGQVPLFPLVREVVEQFRPLVKDGRLVVTSDISDDLEVDLDVDAFKQMLVNLLDNAVKYSPPGEDIDVSLSAADHVVSIAVEDRGPGVPKAEQERVWEAYYRTGDVEHRAVGGTGIGLAVVRDLVHQHKGQVSLSSRDGGGSRFVINLRIVEPA